MKLYLKRAILNVSWQLYRALSTRYLLIGLLLLLCLYPATIPGRLAIARAHAPTPQAILGLGGGAYREAYTAVLSFEHPDLDVWISSGQAPEEIYKIFEEMGVTTSRLHLDYRATDTVSNFTTLVAQFQQKKIEHIYLLTSHFHMARARAVAFFVLGSRGIAVTPVGVPSRNKQRTDSELQLIRDVLRSILWLFTGKTGAHLGDKLEDTLSASLEFYL